MITRFLIACSGANGTILAHCPTERTKFTGIGATIFLTAVLASVSGGYAIYFTFNNLFVAIPFGILWGLVIFNLDRYIVSSIKKSGDLKKELLMAAPRILIALVLAVTISKPLEIKLFDGSISKQMGEMEDQYNKNCEVDFVRQRDGYDQKKADLQTELAAKREEVYRNDPLYKDMDEQKRAFGTKNAQLRALVDRNSGVITANSWLEQVVVNQETGATRNIRRYNALAMDKIHENKKLAGEISVNEVNALRLGDSLKNRQSDLANQVKVMEKQYGGQVAGVQKEIDDFNARRPAILQKCRTDAALDKDILSRLRALGELKSFGNSVWWASTLITLLFILIETAPLLVKLLAKRGPYDEILDRVEYEIYLEQQKIISDKNNEINQLQLELNEANKLKGEIRVKSQQAKVDAELKANTSLLNDIAAKQEELAKIAIRHWYEEQLRKFERDRD